MQLLLVLALATCSSALATGRQPGRPEDSILKKFTNLVTFGDSYTDESRLGYFASHNGNAPPPGTLLPESTSTPGGGITWDRWVSIYSGAKLYDYAVSGAVCSNKMIYRYLASINGPFPDVLGYEAPAFIADVKYINTSTGTNTLYTDREADNTVYSMWIGTNDLGVGALLTDNQTPGTNITTFTECVFQAFDLIYSTGARYFVLMNTAPLQLSPLYGTAAAGGLAVSPRYWPDKPSNTTAVSEKMKEYTTTVNTIWSYQVPFELLIARRYPGAEMAIFDVHGLMTDIYNNPAAYSANSTPLNVTGFDQHCSTSGCTTIGAVDSFMWFDELHPSERTDQIIAKEFIKVVEGNSTYATYWSSARDD